MPDWKLPEGPESVLMAVILALRNEDKIISIFEVRMLDLQQ